MFQIPMLTLKQSKPICKMLSCDIKAISLSALKSNLKSELRKYENDISAMNFICSAQIVLDRHALLTERMVKVRQRSQWFTLEVKISFKEKKKAE